MTSPMQQNLPENGLIFNFDNHLNQYPNRVAHLGTQSFQMTHLYPRGRKAKADEIKKLYWQLYSESCQTSKMEPFAKTVSGLQTLTVFPRNLHLRCLTGFWIRFFIFLNYNHRFYLCFKYSMLLAQIIFI